MRNLLERYRLDPVRCMFIDDASANVRAAARLGFDTIHFASREGLRRELALRGFEVGAG